MFKGLVSTLERQNLKAAVAKGSLACPQCGAPFAGRPTEPSEVITCGSCQHFGSTSEWVARSLSPGAKRGRAGSPPPNTRIQREAIGSTVVWDVPPSGKSGGLVVFGWIWTTFIAVLTSLVLYGLLFGTPGDGWPVILFLIPFWSVGIGLLYVGYRMKNARHKIVIGDGTVTIAREWRGKMKKKSLPLAGLEAIHQTVFYSKNYTPVYGIELKGKDGKLRFGSSLEEAEKAWLVAEFKEAVWPSRKAETVETKAPAEPTRQESFSLLLPRTNMLMTSVPAVAVGAIFVAVAFFVIKDDFVFRAFFGGMGVLVGLIGLGGLVSYFRNRDTEQRLEGTRTHLFLRKSRKGLTLSEQTFPRESFRDIRAIQSGHVNHQPRFKVELLAGGRALPLAQWLKPEDAEAFVEAVKQAMR
jgi:uncharacterized membrane protein